MLRLHRSRVFPGSREYPGGYRDEQKPELVTVTRGAAFTIHMLEWGATITTVNDERIALQTPVPDGGYNDDALDGSMYSHEDIDIVACAVQYWCRLRDRRTDDREQENWRRCAIRSRWFSHTYTDQFAWAREHAQLSTERLRVAVMLACGIDRIADLEAGLAIAARDGDDDRDFLAAVDLWREHQTVANFRDCAALAA